MKPAPPRILPFILIWLLTLPTGTLPAADAGPMVAAASSLRYVLPELADRFAARDGIRPRISFGASGNLRRQITQGAPFHLFLSADEARVLELDREGRTLDEGTVYALGRLALLVQKGSPLAPDGSLQDLRAALDDGRLTRFAIANPDHAPYGRAARETLQRLGLWQRVEPLLVTGENVAQAAQFSATGAAQAGIVALSLARSPLLAECCEHAPIAADLHAPLRQRGALLAGAPQSAVRFFRYLLTPAGQALLKRHGFARPHEAH